MARYVMANRRAGKFQAAEKMASRAAVESSFSALFAGSVAVVNDLNPGDVLARRVIVFDCDPEEANAKAAELPPDVLLEPQILHFPAVLGAASGVAALFAPAGTQRSFTAVITGGGAPLRGADVLLFLVDSANRQTRLTQVSDAAGAVTFSYPAVLNTLGVIVEPAGGFWSMVFRGASNGATLDCPAIAAVGPIDWWHRQIAIHQFNPQLGAGIKVGVIDTGVGPHGCLTHVVSVGAFINGGHDATAGADFASHGSHTTGTIGARPVGPNDRAGIAPGVSLFNARVFPSADVGASQADIANALEELSRNRGVDLINMSLGATRPSAIEQDAIKDALERGTLCVCAAGNDGGAVGWPAAFAETVAVSAIGLKNAVPAGSASAISVPTDAAKIGRAN